MLVALKGITLPREAMNIREEAPHLSSVAS